MRSRPALTLAERQLLALVRALELRPVDWQSGEPIRPTAAALERHAPLLFGDGLVSWDGAVEALTSRALVRRAGDALRVTAAGRSLADHWRRTFVGQGFDARLVRTATSDAFDRLVRRASGLSLRHYSPVDADQLGAAVAALALGLGRAGLDAGCGIGTITEHVARVTGARMTGIDLAASAIALAAERTRSAGLELTFRTGDLDALALPPARLDAVLAVDTLYLAAAPAATIGALARGLRPGGRLVALCSEHYPDAAAATHPEAADRTPAAAALRALGMDPETRDFTESERAYWRAAREALPALESAFRAEGNALLYADLERDAERSGRWIEGGRVRRFLYVAERTSGGSRRTLPGRRRA